MGKKVNSHSIIDFLLILLQVTYGMSMIKVWLLDSIHTPYYINITVITILLYIFRFRNKYLLWKKSGFFLPKILLLIYFLDSLQGLIMSNTAFAFSRGVFMLNIYFFIEYLISMVYEGKNDIKNMYGAITKPYEIYSVYNVVTIFLCAFLILVGALSPWSNQMPENSLLIGNMSNSGRSYYFPGYLSLALDSFRILGQLNIPTLTGLSHEPHALWWLVGPSLYLLLDKYHDNKWSSAILVTSFLFLSLTTTSFTAVIVFFATLIFEILYSSVKKGQNNNFLIIFCLAFIVFTLVLSRNSFIVEAASLFADEKINDTSDYSSMGYSVSSLEFMLSPSGILGWGNVTDIGWGYSLKDIHISLITFILDIILFLTAYVKVIKLYISNNIHLHYLGMACLYFLLHSLKMGSQVFTFPYFAFIVMLVTFGSIQNNRNPDYE